MIDNDYILTLNHRSLPTMSLNAALTELFKSSLSCPVKSAKSFVPGIHRDLSLISFFYSIDEIAKKQFILFVLMFKSLN